ncbi:protein of unknown function [Magnetospirillum gryphiswaldense MSR-1 v2]|uniref:DUF6538 domain-containing protein n=1 Tax=Magnetospirillum gryphiswaldense (strain DSM 6361 / JCM 21280 / NBRC 15271 / MSR-1) TaxID=431944 RepID=V6EZL7_MAGGM|nr:DUF6538 domain-containing protein [Magnetospirillum gryphiswaldense]CDK98695.1 protein of unknown function [Magnetospirillum gryphiswaldense MSR-1 v2]
MANKVRYLLFEDGRYYFFRKISLDLWSHYPKTFINKALGTADRADALEALPSVLHAYNDEFRRRPRFGGDT